jgi:hypothetical protein
VTSEPKAFASLSSGLLARKGAARPAMRPQGFGQPSGNLDDLGWNDMGHDGPRPALSPVRPVETASEFEPQLSRTPLVGLTPASPVHGQQAEIEERFGLPVDEVQEEGEGLSAEPAEDEDLLELSDSLAEQAPAPIVEQVPAASSPVAMRRPEAEPASTQTAAAPKRARKPRSEPVAKDKAAFTLRLDPNRHLKLRLACAVNAKSAQQLVTKALDKLLSSMPELDAMASQAPDRASRKD